MPATVMRNSVDRAIWQAYFKFAFVRNPWDWFVSQHFYNLQKQYATHDDTRPFTPEDILRTYNFLRRYKGVPWASSACQNGFLCDEDGNILVDFLGRFEHLAEDFAKVQSRLEVQLTLAHINSSAHRQYRLYYTNETRELVGALYRRDIEIFGYDF